MRTYEQVYNVLHDDLLNDYTEVMKESNNPKERYHPKIVEFAHELEYYLTLGLNKIGAVPIRFEYSQYRFSLVFMHQTKYYIVSLARYNTRATIYAIPKKALLDSLVYAYNYKYTEFMLNVNLLPEYIFEHIQFPKHAKYEVNDLVFVNKKGLSYLRNKVFKITDVDYKRRSIWYNIKEVKDTGVDNTDYVSETTITKIINGI